ncbi:mitochondrial import inner membrane translocase subunit Tim23-like isoform X1 [Haliotis rubra]|uniref:mitochondrial import inner membrane translocase subunit Tim23-like isoform X1 n=2 Tax=Haliotis rubra TaxID=36100 RepID=UPI001EE59147|nr:mitochondrial import inner membrane translocase subunit Tim23-like isoform X1 [Haliotis rubra]
MDPQKGRASIFSPYSSNDPSMNVPVTAGAAGSIMSPYLNIDPTYIGGGGEGDFIFPEGANRQRGRLELSFSQIGGSVFAGGAVGGLNGVLTGYRETRAAQLTGAVRRTQMLNFITKQGASSAQTLGVIALMYSIFGVVLSTSRGVDDELNTVVAGTATGFLYKSSAGWKKCARGGAIGLTLSVAYVLFTSRDRLKTMIGRD